MPREKQIGVTLTPYVKSKLEKVATIQMKSKSAVCAEAIEMYLDSFIAAQRQEAKQASTIFSGIGKKKPKRESA